MKFMATFCRVCPVCLQTIVGDTEDDATAKTLKHIRDVHDDYIPARGMRYDEVRKCPYCDSVFEGLTQNHAERLLADHIEKHRESKIADHQISKAVESLEERYNTLLRQDDERGQLTKKAINLLFEVQTLLSNLLDLTEEEAVVAEKVQAFVAEIMRGATADAEGNNDDRI